MNPDRLRIRVTFELVPLADGPAPYRRFARLLKFALRCCGFRCVEVSQCPPTAETKDRVPPAPDPQSDLTQ